MELLVVHHENTICGVSGLKPHHHAFLQLAVIIKHLEYRDCFFYFASLNDFNHELGGVFQLFQL